MSTIDWVRTSGVKCKGCREFFGSMSSYCSQCWSRLTVSDQKLANHLSIKEEEVRKHKRYKSEIKKKTRQFRMQEERQSTQKLRTEFKASNCTRISRRMYHSEEEPNVSSSWVSMALHSGAVFFRGPVTLQHCGLTLEGDTSYHRTHTKEALQRVWGRLDRVADALRPLSCGFSSKGQKGGHFTPFFIPNNRAWRKATSTIEERIALAVGQHAERYEFGWFYARESGSVMLPSAMSTIGMEGAEATTLDVLMPYGSKHAILNASSVWNTVTLKEQQFYFVPVGLDGAKSVKMEMGVFLGGLDEEGNVLGIATTIKFV